MGLTGKNNEEKAWNFLKGKIKREKARLYGRHLHRSRRLWELCQLCA